MNEALALARRLVQVNTSAGNESQAAAIIATHLGRYGIESTRISWLPGREMLHAVLPGSNPVVLTGHLDTVPADSRSWTFDPWAGEVSDGYLYGRGSSDMKSGVAALTVAFARHVSVPHNCRGVHLIFTGGEETGCEGASALRLAIDSPRGLVVGEMTGNRPTLGHKGALWLRATAWGRAAHGSRPDLGVNAVMILSSALQRLVGAESWPRHPDLGATTINIGSLHGGVQPNLVPDQAVAEIDMRTVPGGEDLLPRAEQLLGENVELEPTLELAPVSTAEDDPFVELILETLNALGLPNETVPAASYFTDAAVLTRALGTPPTVLLGPGLVDQAHVVDERCPTDAIDTAVAIYQRLLDRACSA
jgi:succinyl-diaminopimelate desuccinylase